MKNKTYKEELKNLKEEYLKKKRQLKKEYKISGLIKHIKIKSSGFFTEELGTEVYLEFNPDYNEEQIGIEEIEKLVDLFLPVNMIHASGTYTYFIPAWYKDNMETSYVNFLEITPFILVFDKLRDEKVRLLWFSYHPVIGKIKISVNLGSFHEFSKTNFSQKNKVDSFDLKDFLHTIFSKEGEALAHSKVTTYKSFSKDYPGRRVVSWEPNNLNRLPSIREFLNLIKKERKQ